MLKIPIFEPAHPDRDDQSLMVDSAERQLHKLSRELMRFERAHIEGDWTVGSDHGINFAISAWQMRDWVWRERSRVAPELFLEVMGIDARCSLSQLTPTLYDHCPELRVCRLIATAAKHVLVTEHRDPGVKVFRAWRHGREQTIWVIEFQDQCRQAVEVFRVVQRFWEHQLRSMFLIEDSFVEAWEPDRFDSF